MQRAAAIRLLLCAGHLTSVPAAGPSGAAAQTVTFSLFMHESAPHVRIGPSGSGARFFRKVN